MRLSQLLRGNAAQYRLVLKQLLNPQSLNSLWLLYDLHNDAQHLESKSLQRLPRLFLRQLCQSVQISLRKVNCRY